MEDLWQQALADIIRAELALSNRTAKDAYTSLGISSTAWQTYFKTRTRDIPSHVLLAVAEYLRMPLSQLIAKTEEREEWLAAHTDPIESELRAGLSRRNRRAVDALAPEPAPSSERPTRKHRSA